MCGKFTAKKSWQTATSLVEALRRVEDGLDEDMTLRVMEMVPVILFDHVAGTNRIVGMRWGFPHPDNWARPQPIHARAETIDVTKAFAGAFRDGQRGIILMNSFNEAPDVEGPVQQHTITPEDGVPLAAAVVWRSFDVGAGAPLFAYCLVTVGANPLIAGLPTDRMPAFIAQEDWNVWLGETPAPVEIVKDCLRTMQGPRWSMTREERHTRARRGKPTVSDPGGLF